MEYLILSDNLHRLSSMKDRNNIYKSLMDLGYLKTHNIPCDVHLAYGLFKYGITDRGGEVLMVLESKTTQLAFDIYYWQVEQFYANEL